jgi:hypothetical protein
VTSHCRRKIRRLSSLVCSGTMIRLISFFMGSLTPLESA